MKSLDHLGFQANDLAELRRLISKSYGILLVTGPTGSGKSTTLYALLNEIKKYEPHIITVEDPVEYNIDGVEQIKISTATGYTFAEALHYEEGQLINNSLMDYRVPLMSDLPDGMNFPTATPSPTWAHIVCRLSQALTRGSSQMYRPAMTSPRTSMVK